MKDILKEEKGITLIALFVTVIVMILLASLVINVSINSKLVDTTREAVNDTNNEEAQIEGRVEGILDEYWEDVTEFKISKNPTYKLYLGELTFLVDEETTWQDLVDGSYGKIIANERQIEGGTDILEVYVNGKGGVVFDDYMEGEELSIYPLGPYLNSRVLFRYSGVDPYITLVGSYDRVVDDYGLCNWEYVKSNADSGDYVYGYYEEI